MYLRWKRRKCGDGDLLLSAVLVKSLRINGKPRQRVVKHLGSIRQCVVDLQLERAAAQFHKHVREALRQTGLSRRQRDRIWYDIVQTLDRLGWWSLPDDVSKDERKLRQYFKDNPSVGTTKRRYLWRSIGLRQTRGKFMDK